MKTKLNKTWAKILKSEFEKDYFKELKCRVDNLYLKKICYPTKENIFASFRNCTFNSLKVVILGQDPYHGINQANGLAFSVNKGQNLPPSLKNIFREISIDMDTTVRNNGDLIDWS